MFKKIKNKIQTLAKTDYSDNCSFKIMEYQPHSDTVTGIVWSVKTKAVSKKEKASGLVDVPVWIDLN